MKKNVLVWLFLSIITVGVKAQGPAVTVDPFLQSGICAGSALSVQYFVDNTFGTFNTNNVFVAQLSDENGSFVTYQNIGSVASTTNGAINCLLPVNLTGGTQYRVRIVSTSPVVTSSDNGLDLTYNELPIANFNLTGNIYGYMQGSQVGVQDISSNGFFYNWDFGVGAIPATSSNPSPGNFVYSTTGAKTIKLIVTSGLGCNDTLTQQVNVYTPNPSISPNTFVASGTITYTGGPQSEVWICSGGVVTAQSVVNKIFYLEPGAMLNMVDANRSLVYAPTGSAVNTTVGGNLNTYITDAGVSVIVNNLANNWGVFNPGGGVSYSYCSAPLTGCVISAPAATITPSGPTTFCIGDSVTLTANTGTSYLWSNGATASSIRVYSTGTYTVAVTYPNGCTRTSGITSITQNPQPVAIITNVGALNRCSGDSVLLQATPGMTSYLWNTTAPTPTIYSYASNSYNVIITNANGCKDTSSTVLTDFLAVPAITANGNISLCEGDSVELVATAGATSYLWSDGQTTQSVWVNQSYGMQVTATGPTTCLTPSSIVYVVEHPRVAPIISPSGTLNICSGDSIELRANTINNVMIASYAWSSGQTISSFYATAANTYRVVLTNSFGCSDSTEKIVNVIPLPNNTVTPAGPINTCSYVPVTLSAPAGYRYVWNNNQGTTQNIVIGNSGNYQVELRDSIYNCRAFSNVVSVTVTPRPNVSINQPSLVKFCNGDSVILKATGATNYLWSTGSTADSVVIYATDTVTVTGSTAFGCLSIPDDQVIVMGYDVPTPTIFNDGADTVCAGNVITLYVNEDDAYSVFWSTGNNTDTITLNNSAANVSVTVTNPGYATCQATAGPVSVQIRPIPQVVLTPQNVSTIYKCTLDTSRFSVPMVSGYSYQWYKDSVAIAGSTLNTFETTAESEYYVTQSDAFGCQGYSSSRFVVIDTLPTPTISINWNATLFTNELMSSGTSAITNGYLWTVNDSALVLGNYRNQTIIPAVNGDYKVRIYSASYCESVSPAFTFASVSAEPVLAEETGWKVYPNPAQEVVKIETDQNALQLEVIDMNGKQMLLTLTEGNAEINVKSLPSGVYTLKILGQDKVTSFRLLIVH